MKQKYYLIFIILGVFLISGCAQKEITKDKSTPEMKYQLFSPGLRNEKIIEYAYILAGDVLPKTIKFENDSVVIEKIEIKKNPTGGFSAYVTIAYDGKQEKIGFWHPDGKIQNRENGCLDQNNMYVCGGILTVETKEWYEEPTEKEKERGIMKIYYLKRIFVQEIDCDINSDNWNFVKIAFALYREEQLPPTVTQQENLISIKLDTPVQLKINQTAFVESENLKIKILNITEDSRCPSNVECFWEGQATVMIGIMKNNQSRNFNLTSRAAHEDVAVKYFDEYYIRLIKIEPYPESTQRMMFSDYIITLIVGSSESCITTDDCVLWMCAGCLNKEWAKKAPPDLPCTNYIDGYSCQCINNKCTEIKSSGS